MAGYTHATRPKALSLYLSNCRRIRRL